MVWIITGVCVLVAITSYLHYKNFLNPITVLYVLWGVLVPLSGLGLYGMDIPSNKAYVIILIGLLAYGMGAFVGRKNITFIRPGIDKNRITEIDYYETRINYPFIYVLCAIAIVYFLSQAARIVPMLLSGRGLDYIRSLAVSDEANELRSSTFVVLIKNFIATPTVYLTIAILPIAMFRDKQNKPFLILVGTMLFLWVLTTGGRSIILWVALYFLFVYTLQKRENRIERHRRMMRRTKILLVIGGILFLYFLLQSTYSRKGAEVDLFRQFCIYFIAPIKFFDSQVLKIDTSYTNYYSYGFASFYGLAYPFLFLLRRLGIFSSYPEFFTLARELSFTSLNNTISIGHGFYMNAFATMFFQPYIDGRYIGVLLVCYLFGLINSEFYEKMMSRHDNRYLLFYLLAFQKIVFSFVRFYYTQPAQAMCFLYSLFAIVYCNRKTRRGIE